ncbi:hypothetical protein [Mesorhizobium sp. B2-3-5]|uniref:hypothetical protein n=1 Tax=Mesorhizobium sp. B2-3-5 TaxID=2589958 RepID=UPI0015E479D6|nr:hypothetical protein [Mesorhizobium sp. B2-3-5]
MTKLACALLASDNKRLVSARSRDGVVGQRGEPQSIILNPRNTPGAGAFGNDVLSVM